MRIKYLAALIALYLCGFVSGIDASAHAGVLTHVAAYEIGKHNSKKNCECPAKDQPR